MVVLKISEMERVRSAAVAVAVAVAAAKAVVDFWSRSAGETKDGETATASEAALQVTATRPEAAAQSTVRDVPGPAAAAEDVTTATLVPEPGVRFRPIFRDWSHSPVGLLRPWGCFARRAASLARWPSPFQAVAETAATTTTTAAFANPAVHAFLLLLLLLRVDGLGWRSANEAALREAARRRVDRDF
jgi:hypothetical protein